MEIQSGDIADTPGVRAGAVDQQVFEFDAVAHRNAVEGHGFARVRQKYVQCRQAGR
jgi:hypothetical protein